MPSLHNAVIAFSLAEIALALQPDAIGELFVARDRLRDELRKALDQRPFNMADYIGKNADPFGGPMNLEYRK